MKPNRARLFTRRPRSASSIAPESTFCCRDRALVPISHSAPVRQAHMLLTVMDCNLHSHNPYCTAVFRTVPRNRIFSSSPFRIVALFGESTYRPHRPLSSPVNILPSAISTLHSENPYCTAVFSSVPRNQFFSESLFPTFPTSMLRLVATSLAGRMLTFRTQVTATTDSDLILRSSTPSTGRFPSPFGVHPLGCLDCHVTALLLRVLCASVVNLRHQRQRKTIVCIPRLGPRLTAATGSDHDKLLPAHRISRRRRVAAGFHLVFPNQLAGIFVEGVEPLVHRRADEHQPARRHQRSADVECAGWRKSLLLQRGICPQRHLPANLASIQVNRVQRAPGTLVDGESVRIAEVMMPRVHIRNLLRPTELDIACDHFLGVFLVEQKRNDRALLDIREQREAWHLVTAGLQKFAHLRFGEAFADTFQRRKCGRV